MVQSNLYLLLAARRALSPQGRPLAGEASFDWCAFWYQGGARYICLQSRPAVTSADCVASTSYVESEDTLPCSGQLCRLFGTRLADGGIWGSAVKAAAHPSHLPSQGFSSRYLGPLSALAPASIRMLHVGSSAAAPASSGESGTGASGGSKTASSNAATATRSTPVQNPLQAALAAASGSQALSQTGAAAPKGRRRQRRTWMWYDEFDEREERRYERAREQYHNVGTAYMSNITQSVKKMNRIVRLVRGLSYSDAVAQCNLVPHKAARSVLQALEAAYEDATQAVGLDGNRLVVGIIYATRGRVEKAMQRMGRGRSGRMFTRTSHLRVVLRESRERSFSFQMRQVAPLMSVMTGATAPFASRLAARAAVARAAARPRFAYQVEV